MSSWIDEYNSTFWMSLSTLVIGAFGMSIKYCLKSRCENLNLCCGLIHIHRRVDLEVQEEMKALELGIRDEENKV
jgi:hypothetical protein